MWVFFDKCALRSFLSAQKKNILRNFFLFLTLINPVLNLMSLFAHVINNNIPCTALKTIKTEKVKSTPERLCDLEAPLVLILRMRYAKWRGWGGGRQSITLRKIKTVFKHHLSLSEDADLLHVNSKICFVTWKFSFFLIFGKKH